MNKGSLVRKAGLAFIATLIAVAGLVPFAPGASAASNYTQTRFAGTDRFDTSALIAGAIAEATPTAVIARADIYPDALTGAFAAAANGDGPLLLTRSDSVPARTLQALQDEGVQNVILLGGTAAISTSVESQLRSAGYNVRRLFGATRYHTASAIARDGAGIVGTVDGRRSALLSSGENFPDALSGAPLSFAAGLPSLLTPSDLQGPAAEQDFFNTEVVGTLNALNIRQVYILGGPAAVAQDVEDALRTEGFLITRLAGGNRGATSVEIFDFGMQKNIYTNRAFGLARGDTFPDALSYAPLAGRPRTSPAPASGVADTGGTANGLLLSNGTCALSTEVEEFIIDHQATWTTGEILGGPEAICPELAARVQQLASTGLANITLNDQEVAPGGTITGNVTGQNIATVTVSGCGLTNEPVTRDANGNFSLTIPTSQTTDCTLTFTTTFTDGRTETDQFPIDVVAPGDPQVALSPTSGTTGSTVTATYSGDRPANITDIDSTNCTVTNEGTQTNNRTFTISGAEGTACQIQTTVQFTDAQGGTQTFTRSFTITSTTQPGGGTQGVGAGPQLATAGPDLLRVDIINGTPNDSIPNQVRYTFDEAVIGVVPGDFYVAGPSAFNWLGANSANIDASNPNAVIAQFDDTVDLRTYSIGTTDDCAVTDGANCSVLASKPLGGSTAASASGRTAAPDLVSATPNATAQQVVYCFDQPIHNTNIDPALLGYYTTSGAVSYGDSFTAVTGSQNCVTVQFGTLDQPVESGHRFFAGDLSAGQGDGAVESFDGTRDNPIGHEPQGAVTIRPDLTGATKVAGQPSQIDFTFDEAVDGMTAVPADFAAYEDDGWRYSGNTVIQVSPTTLRVTFNNITQNNLNQIVLAGVEEDAVFSASNPAEGNTWGDAPLAGATNVGPGFTAGPDLIGATYSPNANQVTFTFDEPIDDTATINEDAFFVVTAGAAETCGLAGTATVSGSSITITFPAGAVSSAAGAGVNGLYAEEDGCLNTNGVEDFLGNVNSPDSVGGGPAPGA